MSETMPSEGLEPFVAMGETKVQPRKIHLPGGPLAWVWTRGHTEPWRQCEPLRLPAAHTFTGSCSGSRPCIRSALCSAPGLLAAGAGKAERTIPCWAGISSHPDLS